MGVVLVCTLRSTCLPCVLRASIIDYTRMVFALPNVKGAPGCMQTYPGQPKSDLKGFYMGQPGKFYEGSIDGAVNATCKSLGFDKNPGWTFTKHGGKVSIWNNWPN